MGFLGFDNLRKLEAKLDISEGFVILSYTKYFFLNENQEEKEDTILVNKHINPDSELNQPIYNQIRGSGLDTPRNGHPEFLNCINYECKTD